MKNEYLPYPVIIKEIRQEGIDTKTFKIAFKDKGRQDGFDYGPGQFMEVSVLGVGEAPISITSSPSRKGFLELTIRDIGKLTHSLHSLNVGDTFYVRGPYGNSFPFDELKGKNIYFIAGGIGLAPLRSLINLIFDHRDEFGHIKILYGARTPDELCFKEELDLWRQIPHTEVWLTVDRPCEGWGCRIGVVTEIWKDTNLHPDNAVAFVCGPPIMIKFVVQRLLGDGFRDEDIIMTLERYMKCGIGKCGHCNIAEKFVCIDGPVFTYAQIKDIPEAENVL